MSALQGNAWPEKKRIEVATAHVMGLTGPQIAVATGVPANTIRQWRMQDWFKDLVEEIQREDDYQADAKLTKIVSKSLDVIVDRLENGDFMYDPKEGDFKRKPLAARDVVKVADIMYDKRNLLRGKPTTISGKDQVSDRLMKLAEQFAQFARARTIDAEVIPNGKIQENAVQQEEALLTTEVADAVHDERAPGLQEGIQEVRGVPGGDSQTSPPESSASGTDGTRIGA